MPFLLRRKLPALAPAAVPAAAVVVAAEMRPVVRPVAPEGAADIERRRGDVDRRRFGIDAVNRVGDATAQGQHGEGGEDDAVPWHGGRAPGNGAFMAGDCGLLMDGRPIRRRGAAMMPG